MKIGYLRYSNRREEDLSVDLEIQLVEENCACLFVDRNDKQRSNWMHCWSRLVEGDELVVSSIVDIADSFRELAFYLGELRERGIKLKSISEASMTDDVEETEENSELSSQESETSKAPEKIDFKSKVRKKKRVRRTYSKEVVDAVLKEISTSDKTIVDIAKQFGVTASACYNWTHRYKVN